MSEKIVIDSVNELSVAATQRIESAFRLCYQYGDGPELYSELADALHAWSDSTEQEDELFMENADMALEALYDARHLAYANRNNDSWEPTPEYYKSGFVGLMNRYPKPFTPKE